MSIFKVYRLLLVVLLSSVFALLSCGGGSGGGDNVDSDPPDPYPLNIVLPANEFAPMEIRYNVPIDGRSISLNSNTIRLRSGTEPGTGENFSNLSYSLTDNAYTVQIHPPSQGWNPANIPSSSGDSRFHMHIPRFGDNLNNGGVNQWVTSREGSTSFPSLAYYNFFVFDTGRVFFDGTTPILTSMFDDSTNDFIISTTLLPLSSGRNVRLTGENFHRSSVITFERDGITIGGFGGLQRLNSFQIIGSLPAFNTAGPVDMRITSSPGTRWEDSVLIRNMFNVGGFGIPSYSSANPASISRFGDIGPTGSTTITIIGANFSTSPTQPLVVIFNGFNAAVIVNSSTIATATITWAMVLGVQPPDAVNITLSNPGAGGGQTTILSAIAITQ